MIEATNSVIANAPLLRSNAEQGSTVRAARQQTQIEISEPVRAPFVSPFIFVDNNFDKAVLQIRDADTGDVLTQFPSESRLAQARREAEILGRQQLIAPDIAPESSSEIRLPQNNTTLASVTLEVNDVGATPPPAVPDATFAAITAFSSGAQSGQTAPATVSVTA